VTYRSIAALKRDQATCRACVEAAFPLESLPVLAPGSGQRAYLFGQAPGVVEGEERRPWRGRAGKTLRRWLDLDEDKFYAIFYCASVTRCYPGRPASGGRGDRTPTKKEQRLCERWRDEELRLLKPSLVVTVGGLALRLEIPGLAQHARGMQGIAAAGDHPFQRQLLDRVPHGRPRRPRRIGARRSRRKRPGSATSS